MKENKEICIALLERLLRLKIKDIVYLEEENNKRVNNDMQRRY